MLFSAYYMGGGKEREHTSQMSNLKTIDSTVSKNKPMVTTMLPTEFTYRKYAIVKYKSGCLTEE